MSVQFNPYTASMNSSAYQVEQSYQYSRDEFLKVIDADSNDDEAEKSTLNKDWNTLLDKLNETLNDQPATLERLKFAFMELACRYMPPHEIRVEMWTLFMSYLLPEKGMDTGLPLFYLTLNQAPEAQKVIRESKFATLIGIK
jgi:hypothetical protein